MNKLLDEYTSVCTELGRIKGKIMDFRNATRDKLSTVKTPNEMQTILAEFRAQLKRIKADKSISARYIFLKGRKNKLRSEIISILSQTLCRDKGTIQDQTDADLASLLEKYQNMKSDQLDISERSDELLTISDADSDAKGIIGDSTDDLIGGNQKLTVSDIHYTEQHNEVNNLVRNLKIST